jgi:hypothetical protein
MKDFQLDIKSDLICIERNTNLSGRVSKQKKTFLRIELLMILQFEWEKSSKLSK